MTKVAPGGRSVNRGAKREQSSEIESPWVYAQRLSALYCHLSESFIHPLRGTW